MFRIGFRLGVRVRDSALGCCKGTVRWLALRLCLCLDLVLVSGWLGVGVGVLGLGKPLWLY